MIIKNVLVVLGPPGSGKGTQGKTLAPIFNYNYLSMGQYLREYTKRDTELARKIKETIDGGHIIPDAWMENIFPEAIHSFSQSNGIILDGFPRDLGQTPIFEKFLVDYSVKTIKVIFLEVAKEDLIKRIGQRESQGGENRADDEPEIIATRFEEYQTKTFPLRKYFEEKGILIPINGNQPIECTHAEILRKLEL